MRSKAHLSEPWGPEIWDQFVERVVPIDPPLPATGRDPGSLQEDVERCTREQIRRALRARAVCEEGWGAEMWALVDDIVVEVEVDVHPLLGIKMPRVMTHVPERLARFLQERPRVDYHPGVPPV